MEIEEYKTKLNDIIKAQEKKRHELYYEYAMANNNVKAADIVTDHIGSVLVDKITVHMGYGGIPECYYRGVQMTKKGIPFKSGERRFVYVKNLKSVNGKEIA